MDIRPDLEIFITEDGSPTLSFKRADGYAEKMHHSGGALEESLYIYHHGLVRALDLGFPPRVISVGLGLGYNELIALAEFSRRGLKGKVWSFEALPELRGGFRDWLSAPGVGSQFGGILEDVCARVATKLGIPDLKKQAAQALKKDTLELREHFPDDAKSVRDAGVVFFDAFSNKMSPELWLELDLENNLAPLLAPRTLLCTYAKTGALKRVLKKLGFVMEERPGFRGKRDSTLAVRL